MGPFLQKKKKKGRKQRTFLEAPKQQIGDARDPSAYRLGRDHFGPYPTQTAKVYPTNIQPVHALSTDYWLWSVSFRPWQI